MKNNQQELKELVAQLQPDNTMVFNYIEKYITNSALYDETSSHALLIDIATHFVEAQKQGIKAKEVVGNDPAKYCRELGNHMPQKHGSYNRLVGFAVAWTAITMLAVISSVLKYQGSYQPLLQAASLALFPATLGIFAALTLRDNANKAKVSSPITPSAVLIAMIIISVATFWVFGFVITATSLSSLIMSAALDGVIAVAFWYQVIQHRAIK
ncbi:MAG: hypothetical protein WAU02_00490 [Candidatus Saccharimonadales bacterium]